MALTEVRALLGTLEFGVTPCTVIAPGLREAVQMLLEKGAPGESPRLMALLLGSALVDTTAVKRDVPPETKAAMGEARDTFARVIRVQHDLYVAAMESGDVPGGETQELQALLRSFSLAGSMLREASELGSVKTYLLAWGSPRQLARPHSAAACPGAQALA